MSNPFLLASPVTFPNGPGQGTDNLTALTSGFALGLGVLGQANVQYYDDYIGPITIKTGASGVVASGVAKLYLILSEDNSHWTDNISPTSTSNQASKLNTARLVQTLNAGVSGTTYYFDEFSINSILGFVPSFWTIVIENLTGGTFDSTAANFYAQHSLVSYA